MCYNFQLFEISWDDVDARFFKQLPNSLFSFHFYIACTQEFMSTLCMSSFAAALSIFHSKIVLHIFFENF